jgi:hypothetical protein
MRRPARGFMMAGGGKAPRRFPAAWVVDRIPGGYVVHDATGQHLALGPRARLRKQKHAG